jgi:hypothetical protein
MKGRSYMIDNTHRALNRRRSPASRDRWPAIALAAIAALHLPVVSSGQTNTFPSSGNVGIGTTSPAVPLDVSGLIRSTATPSFPTSGSGIEMSYYSPSSAGVIEVVNRATTTPLPLLLQPSFGNVGIGTTEPSTTLVVSGVPNVSVGNLQLVSDGNDAGISFFDLDANSNGRHWQIQNNYYAHGNLDFMMGTTNTGNPITPVMSLTLNGNVGIGTTSPQHLLQVVGTIGAEEVIVSATGADYVFRPGYHLSSLDEVSAYIKENHHLPDVPSAAETQTKGLNLGEMQTKLLAKIEELTLHTIEADEHSRHLEQQNRELQERIARLEAAGGDSGIRQR